MVRVCATAVLLACLIGTASPKSPQRSFRNLSDRTGNLFGSSSVFLHVPFQREIKNNTWFRSSAGNDLKARCSNRPIRDERFTIWYQPPHYFLPAIRVSDYVYDLFLLERRKAPGIVNHNRRVDTRHGELGVVFEIRFYKLRRPSPVTQIGHTICEIESDAESPRGPFVRRTKSKEAILVIHPQSPSSGTFCYKGLSGFEIIHRVCFPQAIVLQFKRKLVHKNNFVNSTVNDYRVGRCLPTISNGQVNKCVTGVHVGFDGGEHGTEDVKCN